MILAIIVKEARSGREGRGEDDSMFIGWVL